MWLARLEARVRARAHSDARWMCSRETRLGSPRRTASGCRRSLLGLICEPLRVGVWSVPGQISKKGRHMAKGGREQKKPKKEIAKTTAAAPSTKDSAVSSAVAKAGSGKKK